MDVFEEVEMFEPEDREANASPEPAPPAKAPKITPHPGHKYRPPAEAETVSGRPRLCFEFSQSGR